MQLITYDVYSDYFQSMFLRYAHCIKFKKHMQQVQWHSDLESSNTFTEVCYHRNPTVWWVAKQAIRQQCWNVSKHSGRQQYSCMTVAPPCRISGSIVLVTWCIAVNKASCLCGWLSRIFFVVRHIGRRAFVAFLPRKKFSACVCTHSMRMWHECWLCTVSTSRNIITTALASTIVTEGFHIFY